MEELLWSDSVPRDRSDFWEGEKLDVQSEPQSEPQSECCGNIILYNCILTDLAVVFSFNRQSLKPAAAVMTDLWKLES